MELRLVMEDAFLVCPRGLPGMPVEGDPVDVELARVKRVLCCLEMPPPMPLVLESALVLAVVLVDIL